MTILSVCANCCIILHLGRAATTEEREEWTLQFEAMGGKEGGIVEIERFTSYIKMHDKTGDEVITLSYPCARAQEARRTMRDVVLGDYS